MKKNMQTLSKAEERIMAIIWLEGGEVYTATKLLEGLETKFGIKRARTTLATFLTRMQAKGYISSEREGRCSIIKALVDKDDYIAMKLQNMKEVFDLSPDKIYDLAE